LLSEVAKAFVETEVVMRAAKVMTIGERAEDVFFLTDKHGRVLDAESRALLADRLAERLDHPPDAQLKSA
jgi:[protein-PII] uridylyltransferase